jgi:hypothetical protein
MEEIASIERVRSGHGYYTYRIESYDSFIKDVAPLFISTKDEFVWRGMRDSSWQLESSLSRQFSRLHKRGIEWQKTVSNLTTLQMSEFLNQLRGLSILKPVHDDLYYELQKELGKNYLSFLTVISKMEPRHKHLIYDMFSLGQHHGLYTPFLDWTKVPLIALYFAFAETDSRPDGEGYRVVYALNKTKIEEICPPFEIHGETSILFLGSTAHDNPRIIGQAGLFTFVPAHMPVENWVVQRFPADEDAPILIRFLIRNEKRWDCLANLYSLNIHSRTIFPDLQGAAALSNYLIEKHM